MIRALFAVCLVACASAAPIAPSDAGSPSDASARDVAAPMTDAAIERDEARAPRTVVPPADGDAPGEQECHPPLCGAPDRPQHL